ncbi:MAG TPA: hypothetical protein VIL85_16490 [Thermomicrobiales bacterium]|jgi:hypothetical protein
MPQYRAGDRQLQELAADQELVAAISTVEPGLAILQNNRLYRRNEFPVMLLLSTGIERILKVVLHLATYHTAGQFGRIEFTHNLIALRSQVLVRVFTSEYLWKPNMHADRDYLANDELLGVMIEVLAIFADARRGSRYVHMDSIADPRS